MNFLDSKPADAGQGSPTNATRNPPPGASASAGKTLTPDAYDFDDDIPF
jgi:hypothetical protein